MPTAAKTDFRVDALVETRTKIMARSGQIRILKEEYHFLFIDELIERHPSRWLCKEAKFKAREARGVRRTSSTPQRQRAEAQRRSWTIYEAIVTASRPIAPAR
jgi:hypothetical protein